MFPVYFVRDVPGLYLPLNPTPTPCFLQEYENMEFRVWGYAKSIIIKGLEDVCVVFVSWHLDFAGADTLAFSGGHGPSRLPSFLRASRVNVPCPYLVNNSDPTPVFCKRCG
jgi:hypothetical protein